MENLENNFENEFHKKCQFCSEIILNEATFCKHCNKEQLNKNKIKAYKRTLMQRNIAFIPIFITFFFLPGSFLFIISFIALIVVWYFYRKDYINKLSIPELEIRVKKYKRAVNRNLIILFSVIIFIGFVLFSTNPEKKDYKDALIQELALKNNNNYFKNQLTTYYVENSIIVTKNYYFFSLYIISDVPESIAIGVFNNILFLDN